MNLVDGGDGSGLELDRRSAGAKQNPDSPSPRSRGRSWRTRVAAGMGAVLVGSGLRVALFDSRVASVASGRDRGGGGGGSTMSYHRRESGVDGAIDEQHFLPWLPWERHAMTSGSCHAPSEVPKRCCVGTSSSGGEVAVSPSCLSKGTAPYDQVMERAADFVRRHPVRGPRSGDVGRGCDTCRIVDHLIGGNYTLTFQGDSVMGQVFWGLECELLRRGYAVNTSREDHPRVEGVRWWWRYGIKKTHTLRISPPDPGASPGATVRYHAMYRPALDMREAAMIAAATDILVFDHGLHYDPRRSRQWEEFRNSTTGILSAARNSTRVKLVMWRETTPQHFNTTGGLHVKGAPWNCVPIAEGYEKVHRTIVERAARVAGYARVVDATTLPAPNDRSDEALGSEPDLVVLPYRDFLLPLHELHGNECTHYCASTYMYVPIWRSLRLALDRYLVSPSARSSAYGP